MKAIPTSLLLALWMIAGCATPSRQVAVQPPGTEICCVCEYNNDLACLKVRVNDSTPTTQYQGKTLWFCSQECKKAFLKNPPKYKISHAADGR
jgi:YHS domain-containing protein